MSAIYLPATLPLLKELSEPERAYLAGLIDGEGCITRRSTTTSKLTWRVAITSTSPILRDWLLEHVGGRCDIRVVQSDRHTPGFNWVVERAANVLAVLEATLPYLQIKREKAEVAIHEITQRGVH